MANYFGIDFGTTNCAVVSIVEIDGERIGESIAVGEEKGPLPSFVAINKVSSEVKTGISAKNTIFDSDEYVVFPSIKTIIEEDCIWNIGGREWSQIDIAAELFKALKVNVKDKLDVELEEAVVAVPVGFSAKKKNNIRRAAKDAGITISMFISEPTAAYCSRINQIKKYKNVAVFDWGGGTLDIAILRIDNNVVKEVATAGLPFAGNDIDQKLAEKICTRVSKKNGIDFSFDDLSPEYKLRLLDVCEQAKCNLADEDITTISLAKLDRFGRALERIDYEYFELLIEHETDCAVDCLLEALSNSGMSREDIDCIICEGGSSRLRPLQTKLLEYFDREKLYFPRTAMWDIASGAAEIEISPGCYTLNRPIGLIQANDVFYPLLKVGQRVPTEEKHIKFGLTETTDEARLVFSDGEDEASQTFLETFPVKLRGFSDEFLDIFCYIDADMIFRVKIHSNRMPDDVFRVWTYSNLKVSYEIDPPRPKEKDYVEVIVYE